MKEQNSMDKNTETAETEDISRRTFLRMQMGAVGMAALSMPAMSALASETGSASATSASAAGSSAASASTAGASAASGSATEYPGAAITSATAVDTIMGPVAEVNITSPAEVEAMGESTMSLYELNQRRHALVDSKGDYTKDDGTVIPAVYNKLRALINTFSVGDGNPDSDDSFGYLMMLYSEDDAQAALEMPWGMDFSVVDFAESSGRDMDECEEICEDMAERGLVTRFHRSGLNFYRLAPIVVGSFEYCVGDVYNENWAQNFIGTWSMPMYAEGNFLHSGTPIEYAIPCDESIVADEQIILGDDYRNVVERNDVICVIPCSCRSVARAYAGFSKPSADEIKDMVSEVDGHYLETCVGFGEEAQYMIDRGVARQITKDEALAIFKRSVDAGMILQGLYTKNTEFICSCRGDCCGILKGYLSAGPEAFKQTAVYKNVSHYELQYDKEACIQCGTCVKRCPMGAIEMDADGYPAVTGICMRCGQCGTTCPKSARKLTAVAAEDRAEMPADLLSSWNLTGAYRFEHGYIA